MPPPKFGRAPAGSKTVCCCSMRGCKGMGKQELAARHLGSHRTRSAALAGLSGFLVGACKHPKAPTSANPRPCRLLQSSYLKLRAKVTATCCLDFLNNGRCICLAPRYILFSLCDCLGPRTVRRSRETTRSIAIFQSSAPPSSSSSSSSSSLPLVRSNLVPGRRVSATEPRALCPTSDHFAYQKPSSRQRIHAICGLAVPTNNNRPLPGKSETRAVEDHSSFNHPPRSPAFSPNSAPNSICLDCPVQQLLG